MHFIWFDWWNWFSDLRALLKTCIISLILLLLNVIFNWFLVFSLTYYQPLESSQLNVEAFRIIIATFQIIGSLFCLIVVDFIERKVCFNSNGCEYTKWYKRSNFKYDFFTEFAARINFGNHTFSNDLWCLHITYFKLSIFTRIDDCVNFI